MPAKIIEKNPAPFKRTAVDPITLDIVENALRNARVEMDAVLFRTAMSPGIREQHDAFPLIANQEGKMVVGQFGSFLWGFISGYEGTIEDGDIFLTNDPYSCGGAISHLNDWLLMMPIFLDGRLVSWAAMFGHMTDVGGKVPGSLPTDAKMIYEEGTIIPPVKIYRNGELNSDILRILLSNSRMPHWNRSDFFAIIAALRLAERRVRENIARFGIDTYISAMWEMLERNKRAMSAIIQMIIPESGKRAHFEDWIDDDGMGNGPFKIACTLWREGDKAIFDFDGCDPQSSSSINFLLNEEMFKMFFGAFTINLFDPQILFNDGFYDLLEVRIPDRLHPEAQETRRAVLPYAHARPHLRSDGRLAGAGRAGGAQRRRLLRQPAFHVFRLRRQGRMVSAVPDRFRRHSRSTGRRRPGRALAVAGLHQRAQRIPGSLFPAANPRIRHDPGFRRRGPASRRQRHHDCL